MASNDDVMVSKSDDSRSKSQSLHALADWLAEVEVSDPALAQEVYVSVSIWIHDADKVKRVARALAPCNKRFGDSWMELSRWFGTIRVEANCSRELVCARNVVGTETVVIPERPYQPARVEEREIVEWTCGPIFGETTADETVDEAAESR